MDLTPSPSVRGAILLGLRDWALSNLGQMAYQTYCSALSPSGRLVLEDRALLNNSQVDAATFRDISERLIALHGLDGERGFHSMAGHIAMEDLGSTMKVLMRLGSPEFVLHRFPRIWRHYFSHGTLAVETSEKCGARVIVRDAACYGIGAAEGTSAWMRAALRYAGAKAVRVTRNTGKPLHQVEYSITWM